MEKALTLHFPNLETPLQIEVLDFTYSARRMGEAPNITFSINYALCLDDVWDEDVYTIFNGEKYFLKNIPTSQFDNSDARYKYDVALVSERVNLDNVYFFDVVSASDDKPVSNSTKVIFSGNIQDFADRMNLSMRTSGLDYTIVVDEGVTNEYKILSFDDKYITDALKEVCNLFGESYYFVGKEIHFGKGVSSIEDTFEYGSDNALLSISKNNTNNKIVTRCTGDGSDTNIPYYYPNASPYGRVRALYNGKENNNLKITSWELFSRCGVDSTLVLKEPTYTPPRVVATIEDFTDGGEYQNLDSKKYYKIKLAAINLTKPTVVSMTYGYLGYEGSFGDISKMNLFVEIKDSNNNILNGTTASTLATGIELEAGEYIIRVYFEVPKTQNATFLEVNRAFINLSFGEPTGNPSWALDDNRRVTLSSVGITFVGDSKIGDTISFQVIEQRVPICTNLMPYVYRSSGNTERFYNAENGKYNIPGSNGETYHFNNEYSQARPKEHIVHFEDIKPTIEGITNARGQRIDMFSAIEYDLNDSDEKVVNDGAEEYLHKYFFVKLKKFDGQNGFNLFSHAIEGRPMTLSMTSGSCSACEWVIQVSDDTLENRVQVYEEDTTDANGVLHKSGDLKRNDNGDVIFGTPQACQNDTTKHEVWVAVLKDQSTFGTLMPKAPVIDKDGTVVEHGYRPSINDTFVILNISLPEPYIWAAEQRLEEEIIKYMSENNDEKFKFSIKFSRIYLAENRNILDNLTENSIIKIKYNNKEYSLTVSSFSYKMSSAQPLPEVIVELSDEVVSNNSPVQTVLSAISKSPNSATVISQTRGNVNDAGAILTSVAKMGTKSPNSAATAIANSIDIEKEGKHFFVSKKGDESISGEKTFQKDVVFGANAKSADYSKEGLFGSGWAMYRDVNGKSIAEFDKIIARQELEINDLKINQITFDKGTQILSSGGCVVETVEDLDDVYRCYFDNKNGTSFSGFVVGDVALCQRYDESYANIVKNYRRKVVGVSASYVDLSKSEFYGDGVPAKDDTIIQFGNTTDTNRQYVIIRDVVGGGNERMLSDLDSVNATGVEYYFAGRIDGNTPRWFVGNKSQQFIEYKDGRLQIKADVTIGANSDLSASEEFQEVKQTAAQAKQVAQNAEASAKSYAEELVKDLQNQLDGKVESYFFDYDPTTSNIPASEWTTNELKEEHLNDTFTNTESGQSWRWLFKDGSYQWVAIADTQSAEALAKAQEALGVANGKVAVFVTEPRTPYNAKDLWLQGEDGRIKRCTFTRTTTGEFYEEDWVNADDSHEYTDGEIAKYKKSIDATIESLDAAIEAAEKASKDYTDEGKKALQASIDALNKAKANATDVYDKATADGLINQAEADAIAAAQEFAASAQTLAEETAKAYADGVVDEEEKARLAQAEQNLKDAKNYAEQKATEAENNAKSYADQQIATVDYLKQAFPQGSILDVNGVTLSALVGVKDENGAVVAGLYGGSSKTLNDAGYADSAHGAMLLFGGIEGVNKPKTYKTAIFEDGFLQSTYFATARDGKRVEIFGNELKVYGDDANNSVLSISYDSTGKPRLQYTNKSGNVAWYLSDSGISTSYTVEQADKTFVSVKGNPQTITTQHDFANGLKIGGLSLRKVDDYLYLDSSLVLSGGVTMYGDDGTTVKPIWESIPFDRTTIDWVNGQWTVVGGVGSGGGISEEFLNVKLQSYQPLLSTTNKLPYSLISGTPDLSVYAKLSDIPSLSGYATQSWVEGRGYLLATTASSTYQPKITTSNKLAYSLISGTPDLSVYALKTAIPTKLSQLTDDVVSGKYLSINGGTVDGNLFIGNAALIFKDSIGDNSAYFGLGQNMLGNDYNGASIVARGDRSIYFVTNGSLRTLITPSGNVAIGGTTADAKLHVHGNGIFTDNLTVPSITIGGLSLRKVDDYLYLDSSLVLSGGVTMYGDDGTTVKPIWESIPFDRTTIDWVNGQWTVVGGVGGSGISEDFLNTKLQGYQPLLSATNKLPYSLISGTPDLSVYFLKSSFTKANIKSTLGISDWALANVKPTYTASEVGALGVNDTATNANKLGGYLPTTYMRASGQYTDSLNDLTSLGIYRMSGTITDGPSGAGGYGNLMVVRSNSWDSLSQLYFNANNNRIFVRNGTNSNFASRDWSTLAYISDIPTKLSQLTDDVVAGKYLPLSGGTISKLGRDLLIINDTSSSTVNRGAYITFTSKAGDSQVKVGYNTSTGAFFNIENSTTGKTYTVRISKDGDGVSYDNQPMLHSGNVGDYALPISGGTVKGSITTRSNVYSWANAKTVGHIIAGHNAGGSAAPIISTALASGGYGKLAQVSDQFGLYAYSASDSTPSVRFALFPEDGAIKIMGNTIPMSTTTYNLGSSSAKWSNVYATSFIGSLTGNADSATKLATARTIWGNDFDGSAPISGNIIGKVPVWSIMSGEQNIIRIATTGTVISPYDKESGWVAIRTGAENTTGGSKEIRLLSSGNVAIGGTAAEAKLHVHGTAKFTGDTTFSSKVVIGTIPVYQSADGTLFVDANVVFRGGVAMYGNTTTTINEE